MRNFCKKTKSVLLVLLAFVFPISLAATNALIALGFLCWLIEGNFKTKFKTLKENIFIKLFLGIISVLLISAFFSDSITGGFLISSGYKNEYQFILKHFVWFFVFFVLLLTSDVKKEKLISAFLIGMFFSEIVSYLIYFRLIDLNYFKSLGLINRGAQYINPTPFMHHTFYSIFLAVSIVLIMDKLKSFRGVMKFVSILFLISATVNLFINGGRTGQLAFVLSVFVYAVLKYRHFKAVMLSLLLIAGVLFSAYKFSPVFHKRVNMALHNLVEVREGNFNTSWGKRIAVDIVGFELLKNPKVFIFGLGAGDAKEKFFNFAKEYNRKMFNQFKNLVHLHNQFLQFWMDGGIFLMILYLLWFVFWYRLSPTPLSATLIVIFVFASFSDVIMYRPKTFMLFLFLTSLSICRETSNTGRDSAL